MKLVSAIEYNENTIIASLLAGPAYKSAVAPTICRLYKNDLVPGPQNQFGDFVEADFTGYANQAISAWLSHIDGASGRPYIQSGAALPNYVVGAGPVTPNTVYGWYIEDGSSNLLLSGRFDTPIQMDATGKTITLFHKVFATGLDGPDALED